MLYCFQFHSFTLEKTFYLGYQSVFFSSPELNIIKKQAKLPSNMMNIITLQINEKLLFGLVMSSMGLVRVHHIVLQCFCFDFQIIRHHKYRIISFLTNEKGRKNTETFHAQICFRILMHSHDLVDPQSVNMTNMTIV